MKSHLKKRRALLTSTLGAAVLAACGGGGGDDVPAPVAASPSPAPAPAPANTTGPAPAPAPVGTSAGGSGSAVLRSDVGQIVAFVGDTKTPQITVIGANGAVVASPVISWATSDAAVASVSPAGVITIGSVGTATVTATSQGVSLPLAVTAKAAPTKIADLRDAFPYVATSTITQGGTPSITVLSDVSDAFSVERLANLEKGWQYLKSTLFGGVEPAPWEFFYTADPAVMSKYVAPLSGQPFNNDLEVLGTGGAKDAFYVGTTRFDFVHQQHELGERFVLGVEPNGRSWAWIYEGMGLFVESGRFDSASSFTVTRPNDSIVADFRDKVNTPNWRDLSQIFLMDYPTLVDRTSSAYAGAGVLMFYLWQNYRNVIPGLIAGMRTDAITTREQARDYVLAQTGLTIGELETKYREFGKTLVDTL